MTAPMETQTTIELKANAKMLRKQAPWRRRPNGARRTASTPSCAARSSSRRSANGSRLNVVRSADARNGSGESERQMLARPLLKGVMVMTRESE